MSGSPTASQLTAAVTGDTSPSFRTFRLEVLRGPDAGTVYTSERELAVVGTHRSGDLVLTDRTVSRFHCELAIAGDALRLRDLGSRNGTRLDEVFIESARLHGPAILQLGRTELRVELCADSDRVQVAGQERFGALIGRTPALRAAFARLQQAAATDANLLIEGEPGTGKDTAAAAVHEHSARRDHPLDVVDCAAPDAGVQLFGRGSRPGALERCDRGTLVLDDLGALPAALHKRLLRVIDTTTVRRLDGGPDRDADVRIIALSRRNLHPDVNDSRLDADLYQAIAVVHVQLPPLRACTDDLPLFVQHLLERAGVADTPVAAGLLTTSTIDELRRAPWPGNLRELRTHLERLAAGDPEAPAPGAPPLIDGTLPLREARRRWVAYFERTYLEDLLARHDGNVSAAARAAGVDRIHIHRLLAKTGLRQR